MTGLIGENRTGARHDFTIDKNATFSKTITITLNGSPVDLTGWSAEIDIRDSSRNEIITLTEGNSRITMGGEAGTIALEISASDTAAISESNGVYDLRVTDDSSVINFIIYGDVYFIKSVTK